MKKLISYLVIVSSGLILSTTVSQAASILLTSTEVEFPYPDVEPDPPDVEPDSGGNSNPEVEPARELIPIPAPARVPAPGEPVTVPEPATIFGLATVLGCAALLKRESFKKKNKS